ncbi:MAG: YlxR family protein [Firmicutes bacterium]|nr:YlxR family protein [Bacillota bacterium]
MKEVLRMCIVCKQMKDRTQMLRFIKTADNEIIVDKTQKRNCRGAYVCNCEACLTKLKKTKALSRAFKMPIEDKLYESIQENLKEN